MALVTLMDRVELVAAPGQAEGKKSDKKESANAA
jgi:hypothetical protein